MATDFEPVEGAGYDDFGGDVAVVRFGDQAVPLPLAARNLSEDKALALRDLMLAARAYEDALERVFAAVDAARAEGVSWDLVGFAIGRTGSSARKRFGDIA